MQRFSLDIDTGGICNLRCPACAQGNVKEYRLPHGFLDPELLKRILDKAASEFLVQHVNLFIWSEPLLHEKLPELIRIVRSYGIQCNVSSNLNILPDAIALMSANPSNIKVSVSGFSQEVYGKTHQGGDIERVKKNLVELTKARQCTGATTRIYVEFHRYRHNMQEEILLRNFLKDIGVDFQGAWAQFLPLEKILRNAQEEDLPDIHLTDQDLETIHTLALPLADALAVSRKRKDQVCPLRERQLSIDFQGNVQLCCGAFDSRKIAITHFLDLPIDKIQSIRRNHPLCTVCVRQGGHVYLTQAAPEFDSLALANVDPELVRILGLRHEARLRQFQRIMEFLYVKSLLCISPRNEALLAAGIRNLQRFLTRLFNRNASGR